MSATTELLKAKQYYTTHAKVFPIRLTISLEFKNELMQDETYKKKASGNGTFYMGCYVELDDTQIEPFIFSGGSKFSDG